MSIYKEHSLFRAVRKGILKNKLYFPDVYLGNVRTYKRKNTKSILSWYRNIIDYTKLVRSSGKNFPKLTDEEATILEDLVVSRAKTILHQHISHYKNFIHDSTIHSVAAVAFVLAAKVTLSHDWEKYYDYFDWFKDDFSIRELVNIEGDMVWKIDWGFCYPKEELTASDIKPEERKVKHVKKIRKHRRKRAKSCERQHKVCVCGDFPLIERD